MKTLTLLRHAKSSWGDPGLDDFDRPLNPRGVTAATRMGREFSELCLSFDLILASPARRVVETLDRLAQGYEQPLTPRFDRQIYAASADRLLAMIRTTHDRVERLLIVGHNPGLEQLAIVTTTDDERGLRKSLATKYPTAALAEISLAIALWSEVGTVPGQITRFLRPRDLAADPIR